MKHIITVIIAAVFVSCAGRSHIIDERTEHEAIIYPDYSGVTVPPNIAPLNFLFADTLTEALFAVIKGEGTEIVVDADRNFFSIDRKEWHAMLDKSKGRDISITVVFGEAGRQKACKPFTITVAEEPSDSHIAYRLIEPGYALWNDMGIYQRDITSFKETAILENKLTEHCCMNCHSFCNRNPEKMLFHLRGKNAGTVIINGDNIEILDTKTDKTVSALVYPSWHSSGDYVAFSVNKTTQGLHAENRVEVYDTESDVVVYDVKKHTVISSEKIFSKNNFETFPTFSPDGSTLYFCTASACPMPDSIARLRYSLCSVSFDAASGTFGNRVDTLINASIENMSVSFPRVSPDGKYLVCTISSYATFPIWHKDADLFIIDLANGKGQMMTVANSPEADSYHSWSSNSRWLIFGSRRMDGLYTRPFMTYIDADGRESKPFVIPQKERDFYTLRMKSFNIPEFISAEVPRISYKISNLAKAADRTGISIR